MNDFKEDDDMQFSWTGLFFATGLSLMVFSFFMKILDGEHETLFLQIGGIALLVASVLLLNKYYSRKRIKKNSPKTASIFLEE